MKRCKSILIIGILALALVLSGILVTVFCSVPLRTIRASMVRETVLQTDAMILERDGLRLRVLDLEYGETFTIKPVRTRKAGPSSDGLRPVRCLVQTETILIETAPGVVIVTHLETGRQYAIPFP